MGKGLLFRGVLISGVKGVVLGVGKGLLFRGVLISGVKGVVLGVGKGLLFRGVLISGVSGKAGYIPLYVQLFSGTTPHKNNAGISILQRGPPKVSVYHFLMSYFNP